jgi:hypothetical protein
MHPAAEADVMSSAAQDEVPKPRDIPNMSSNRLSIEVRIREGMHTLTAAKLSAPG